MKIILTCNTVINGEKIPAFTPVTQGKETVDQRTCLAVSDEQARAAINRQHAKLASATDHVNYKLSTKKAEK